MRIGPNALGLGAALLALAACGGSPTEPNDIPELRVVNTGASRITLINISPCNDSQWGPNRAGAGIESGRNREFQLTAGCYDLRAGRSISGNVTTEKRGVLIQSGVTYIWEVTI